MQPTPSPKRTRNRASNPRSTPDGRRNPQTFSWADATAFIVLLVAAIALIGMAIAAFVQLRKAKIMADQENDLRQLVGPYEHLAENILDAHQRVAVDMSELRSRTASIEQILRTVE